MTQEEYLEEVTKIDNIFEEYEKSINSMKKNLVRKYCSSNNTVKIGDIIENSYTRIIVDKITIITPGWGTAYPYCRYEGRALKKDYSFYVHNKLHCISQNDSKIKIIKK